MAAQLNNGRPSSRPWWRAAVKLRAWARVACFYRVPASQRASKSTILLHGIRSTGAKRFRSHSRASATNGLSASYQRRDHFQHVAEARIASAWGACPDTNSCDAPKSQHPRDGDSQYHRWPSKTPQPWRTSQSSIRPSDCETIITDAAISLSINAGKVAGEAAHISHTCEPDSCRG